MLQLDQLNALLDALFEDLNEEKVWAILDGAQDEQISRKIATSSNASSCLFKGAPPVLDAAAPWLVALGGGPDAFCEWLAGTGFGQAWGIFAVSAAPFKGLRRHLRQFLRVKRKGGQKLFFRYYDPRVWRTFLPACSPTELEFLFGPIEAFYVESSDPNVLLRFERGPGGELSRREILLRKPGPAPAVLLESLRAEKQPDAIDQVRLALAQAPGDPSLLEFLDETTRSELSEFREPAATLKEALDDLQLAGFSTELRGTLQAFPGEGTWREPYAALAPLFQGWLDAEERQELHSECECLIHLGKTITEVRALRERLRTLGGRDATEEEKAAAIQTARDDLLALESRVKKAKLPADHPRVEKLIKGLTRLNDRLAFRAKRGPAGVVAGISSLLVSLQASRRRGKDCDVAEVAEAIVFSLESTQPETGA